MPLEATMMIVDNSEYMRNGDYQPSRFEAQADAVNVVFQTKIDSNPENTVGVMSMAGKGPQVLVTHSKDLGQILSAMHKTASSINGQIDLPTAISVAQLALKHRENKNLRQRIIVFIGSPLEGPAADEKNMVKLAKKLKKNNVAVDVVCFGDGIEEERQGEGEEGKPVLKAFVESVSSGDNSHYLAIPPSANLISDALISSPILSEDRSASIPAELGGTGGGGGAGPSGSGASNDFEFGVDPSLDPELAMALRLSMQEAQAREAAVASTSSSDSAQPATTTTSSTNAATGASAAKAPADPTEDEEEALLKQAIEMSTDQDVDMDAPKASSGSEPNAAAAMDEDEDEEAAIARAIQMSMQQEEQGKNK